MFFLTKYGPYVCIGVTIAIIVALWVFFGGNEYEFIGYQTNDNSDVCYLDNNKAKEEVTKNVTDLGDSQGSKDFDKASPAAVDTTPVVSEKFACAGTSGVGSKKFVSKGERICCETMQQLYGLPFTSSRPEWLINSETGRSLELDCYNEELQIAVEYNGEQHYKWPNFTNQSYDQFIEQVRRDQYKTRMCQQHNVYLITVPYNVKHNKIHEYIISHLPETIQNRLSEVQS